MNLSQGKELFTLITTVRHVEEMKTSNPFIGKGNGCLLCEGMRHGLYSNKWKDENNGMSLSVQSGFAPHFGCTEDEARRVIYHPHITSNVETTGENYYQAGKELLEKYGFGYLFTEVSTQSFDDIMAELTGVEA